MDGQPKLRPGYLVKLRQECFVESVEEFGFGIVLTLPFSYNNNIEHNTYNWCPTPNFNSDYAGHTVESEYCDRIVNLLWSDGTYRTEYVDYFEVIGE